ncbi:MAG: hypothetical protein JKY51_04490 [Opitutaceae bacterium]|nr:hypothetical protein [Opitutaceae bacterium]
MDTELKKLLVDLDKTYDPECCLVQITVGEGAYHCSLPVGSLVHFGRRSLAYVIYMLELDPVEERKARACDIVRAVLALQDRDPISRTYGIWPLYLEEPLSVMKVPDWNYASFVGSQLIFLRHRHASVFPPELLDEIEKAALHAAWSVFRRNSGPDYTNVAFPSAGVAVAVGEFSGDPFFVEYGRKLLTGMVEDHALHGGFNEYNSPGYTLVCLNWCEWILDVVVDVEARRMTEKMRTLVWEDYADHFHPGTGQLAGPQSRSYHEFLLERAVFYLENRAEISIPHREEAENRERGDLTLGFLDFLTPSPCPDELRKGFVQLETSPIERKHVYLKRADGSVVSGVTWMDEDACLGSVNRDNLWDQRRPVLGYWRTENDPAVCFRVRFLKNGVDFASTYISSVQKANRVLSVFSLLTHKGDWHEHLDRPEVPGVFEASDFRIRFQLIGKEVGIRGLGDLRFELFSGDRRLVVHGFSGQFGEGMVDWQIGESSHGKDKCVYVDAVCYSGAPKVFDFREMGPVVMGAGMELLKTGDLVTKEEVNIEPNKEASLVVAKWGKKEALEVEGPLSPGAHPCSM